MKKIAIIGTGIMGAGIASNFLKKGYEVYVWNRSNEKLNGLLAQGGKIAFSPKEAAEKADIVFEVTSNDKSSKSVWLGENGIINGAHKNSTLIASASLSAEWVDELNRICDEKNLTFFDMPLTGGRAAAESGNLILLVGGDEKKLEELKPDLSAISAKVFYFGATGNGARFKLILNMLQGIHLVAFGDAMKMAKNLGMDINAVGEALAERMGGTTAMGWRDYENDVSQVNFSAELIDKDLHYAKKLANGEPTPILDEALRKFDKVVQNGNGSEDWTVVNKI
jgi:3-hydroxyisobutyrate dehydrogenase-like beta-hydroxyacid dehydrogenase